MSYSGYYSSKNCCVKKPCSTPCPTGPAGPIGPIGPIGPAGPKGIDLSGNCFGDYIYWDTSTNYWLIGSDNITLGCGAGEITQGQYSVAVGFSAGNDNQGQNAISIGRESGETSQNAQSISIGFKAGQNTQNINAISIGSNAGQNTQNINAIAIGPLSGQNNQGEKAIAIGLNTGNINQGPSSISIGDGSGQNTQGQNAISIGVISGNINQGTSSIAIGAQSGRNIQGSNAIAIGVQAGQNNQGQNAVAIGNSAGNSNQPANSIVMNATGSILNGSLINACYIKPIRESYNTKVLLYNTTEGEVTYSSNNNQFDASGNLSLSCNLIKDVSGIYFCDGTYIGHGSSFDISSSEIVHLKSDKDIILQPNNLLAVKGTLDMCGNTIIDLSLNFNGNSINPFLRYNTSTRQMSYKSMNYATLVCDVSQNVGSNINTVIPLVYNKIDISNGIYYDNMNPSHILFTQPGVYKIGTSIQFFKSQGTASNVYVWFKTNSGNIDRSASIITLPNGESKIFSYVEIIHEITLPSSQYVYIVIQTTDEDISTYAEPANNIPAVPSIITTVIQIA